MTRTGSGTDASCSGESGDVAGLLYCRDLGDAARPPALGGGRCRGRRQGREDDFGPAAGGVQVTVGVLGRVLGGGVPAEQVGRAAQGGCPRRPGGFCRQDGRGASAGWMPSAAAPAGPASSARSLRGPGGCWPRAGRCRAVRRPREPGQDRRGHRRLRGQPGQPGRFPRRGGPPRRRSPR